MIRSTARSWWLAVALFAASGAGACAQPNDVGVQKDMEALRQELAASRRAQDDLRNRIDRLEARTQLRETAPVPVASVPASGDSLPIVKLTPPGSATNAPDVDTSIPLREGPAGRGGRAVSDPDKPIDMNALIDRQTLADGPAEKPAPRRAEHSEEKADAEFQEAIISYNNGQFAEAAAGFRAFASRHPSHTAAADAMYLAGMSQSSAGHCDDAMPLFDSVLKRYSDSEVSGRALLGMGECEAKSGRPESARKYFKQVMAEHPRSAEASQAKAALADLTARSAPIVEQSGNRAPQ